MIQATDFSQTIAKALSAKEAIPESELQELWSGYGKIMRYKLIGCNRNSAVVKIIVPPEKQNHPRGWSGERSHQRKLKSYQVEKHFYQYHSNFNTEYCMVPSLLAVCNVENATLLVLEDLAEKGFKRIIKKVNETEFHSCISWLAHFHAQNMNIVPEGLWESGTYWHLQTRPDELKKLQDLRLKKNASKIDAILSKVIPQTIVHGDAKLANFCFSESGKSVAAVDFQYVGGGCGMKDLQLFVGSCHGAESCESGEDAILDSYFKYLDQALTSINSSMKASEVETSWRPLYSVAWADFHRFLKGWSPDHWKINHYTERQVQKVLDALDAGD